VSAAALPLVSREYEARLGDLALFIYTSESKRYMVALNADTYIGLKWQHVSSGPPEN